MHPPNPGQAGFKRQVVFRIGADDWPLLEAAAREHGSIQAAVLAGIRALTHPVASGTAPTEETANPAAEPESATRVRPHPAAKAARPNADPDEEIPAREAAAVLGLKPGTISGYIRSGRLPGRYDAEPHWRGWLTTRGAITAYRAAHPRG